jgi:hypothetical protein
MEQDKTFEANSGRRMLEGINNLRLGSIQICDDDDNDGDDGDDLLTLCVFM